MKRFISSLFFSALIVASQISTAGAQVSVEVFDKNGAKILLSQDEVNSIASNFPLVRSIIANFKESAYGGDAVNLYIKFQLKDGTWKETAAGINGGAPVSWHIRKLIKDELK
jgi:hypothetical protein